MWIWRDEHKKAFDEIKKNFIQTVFISYVIPGARFKVQTDASDTGIAVILYQIDSEGFNRLISTVSRCLTSVEERYSVTERELFVIVYSVSKFYINWCGF